jgi:hypothetical protein
MMMATLTPAASLLHKHTYTLGRSLYVPLTCRCNTIPLPVTRGPGFLLPKSITDALVSVRNLECGDVMGMNVETTDERVALPDFPKRLLVNSLYDDVGQSLLHSISTENDVLDDRIQPSISTLIDDVISQLDFNSHGNSSSSIPQQPFDQVVIAGEGEPTLRMDALLSVSREIQLHRQAQNQSPLPIRVITNGLVYTIPNFGYSPYNPKRKGILHRHVVLRDMKEAGITRLSVALNTANRHEYDTLMEPTCLYFDSIMPGMAHDMVCEFILEAGRVGMEVEVTGIDRPDVDKADVDRLARMLLSVGDRKKRSKVRWRKYFE